MRFGEKDLRMAKKLADMLSKKYSEDFIGENTYE